MDIQDAADADGDGDVDLFATSYISEPLLIFENGGAGRFQVMARSDTSPLGAVVGDNHLDRHRQASWPPPPAVGRA